MAAISAAMLPKMKAVVIAPRIITKDEKIVYGEPLGADSFPTSSKIA